MITVNHVLILINNNNNITIATNTDNTMITGIDNIIADNHNKGIITIININADMSSIDNRNNIHNNNVISMISIITSIAVNNILIRVVSLEAINNLILLSIVTGVSASDYILIKIY